MNKPKPLKDKDFLKEHPSLKGKEITTVLYSDEEDVLRERMPVGVVLNKDKKYSQKAIHETQHDKQKVKSAVEWLKEEINGEQHKNKGYFYPDIDYDAVIDKAFEDVMK